jgi:hypothetical protein
MALYVAALEHGQPINTILSEKLRNGVITREEFTILEKAERAHTEQVEYPPPKKKQKKPQKIKPKQTKPTQNLKSSYD